MLSWCYYLDLICLHHSRHQFITLAIGFRYRPGACEPNLRVSCSMTCISFVRNSLYPTSRKMNTRRAPLPIETRTCHELKNLRTVSILRLSFGNFSSCCCWQLKIVRSISLWTPAKLPFLCRFPTINTPTRKAIATSDAIIFNSSNISSFHLRCLQHFINKLIALPLVADENPLHTTHGIHHHSTQVVIEAAGWISLYE
jgi:hypothetical protein